MDLNEKTIVPAPATLGSLNANSARDHRFVWHLHTRTDLYIPLHAHRAAKFLESRDIERKLIMLLKHRSQIDYSNPTFVKLFRQICAELWSKIIANSENPATTHDLATLHTMQKEFNSDLKEFELGLSERNRVFRRGAESDPRRNPDYGIPDELHDKIRKHDTKLDAFIRSQDPFYVRPCKCAACRLRTGNFMVGKDPGRDRDARSNEGQKSNLVIEIDAVISNAGLTLELGNRSSALVDAGVTVDRLRNMDEPMMVEMLATTGIKQRAAIELIASAKSQIGVIFVQGSASYMIKELGFNVGELVSKAQVLLTIEQQLENGMLPGAEPDEIVHDFQQFCNFLYGATLLNSTAAPCVYVLSKRRCTSDFGPLYTQLWAGYANSITNGDTYRFRDEGRPSPLLSYRAENGDDWVQSTAPRDRVYYCVSDVADGGRNSSPLGSRVPRGTTTLPFPAAALGSGTRPVASRSTHFAPSKHPDEREQGTISLIADLGAGQFKWFIVKTNPDEPVVKLKEKLLNTDEIADDYRGAIKEIMCTLRCMSLHKKETPPAEVLEWIL